jgi:DNA-binding PadR family transcriptional regulator
MREKQAELEMKKCMKCGETKGREEFYRHAKMADGLLSKCKTCTKRDVRENRARKIEYYREFDRARANLPHRVEARAAYAQTPEGKEALRRGSAAWRKRNPIKKAASTAVNNAVRDGRLTRQPCEICGKDKAHAHHDDYSKPLDVRWLCTTHHMEWHKRNTPLCPDQEQAE